MGFLQAARIMVLVICITIPGNFTGSDMVLAKKENLILLPSQMLQKIVEIFLTLPSIQNQTMVFYHPVTGQKIGLRLG